MPRNTDSPRGRGLASGAWAFEWALEDLPAARELVETTEGAELFLYPGDHHLFADTSLPDYDQAAATLLEQRVLRFLDSVR